MNAPFDIQVNTFWSQSWNSWTVKKNGSLMINTGWCHAKPTMDGVKFVNLTCWKIEENHTSSCSLAIITYGSILGFS